MGFEVLEYTVSKHYLPAIINGDYSSLDDNDNLFLDSWLDDINLLGEGHFSYDNSGENFTTCEISGDISDCAELKFLYTEDRGN